MDAHPRGWRYIEEPANVKSPGVAIHARRVLAFEVRPEGAAHDRGVVHARLQVDFSPLVADAAADAGGFAQLVGNRWVDIERLHLGHDPLEAADPVGVVFGLEAEWDADADAEVHARIQVHHIEHARHDGVFTRITSIAAGCLQRRWRARAI